MLNITEQRIPEVSEMTDFEFMDLWNTLYPNRDGDSLRPSHSSFWFPDDEPLFYHAREVMLP